MKVVVVAGARPNFVKVAPIIRELRANGARPHRGELRYLLVHTGQHYDYEMSRSFFEELDIPEPDHFLDAGSGSHAEQTGKVMLGFEKICARERPDVVMVVGDVNSTLACSIVGKKAGARIAHVEAGLRSRDPSMPEETNRIMTDSISDLLFVSERSGIENLKREGRSEREMFLVGNVMIDTLHYLLRKTEARGPSGDAPRGRYGVLTLHRPSNVDVRETLEGIVRAVAEISRDMPVYFPAHPRTRKNLEFFGLMGLLDGSDIRLRAPAPYAEFLGLWKDASLVLTDSGGIQEETTALGVPCFTIRENTERPITVEQGSNTLVGTREESILESYRAFREGARRRGRVPELWDGRAAERIVDALAAAG